MKRIEDEFQALVTDLGGGRLGPLSDAEHRCVTRSWGLWHWRNHFIDSPMEDVKLSFVAGESMSVDQKEILESRGYAFAVGDGRMPARMMIGLHIQIAIDRHEMTNGRRRWGLLRSPALPLVIGDRPGDLLVLPASPRILFAADHLMVSSRGTKRFEPIRRRSRFRVTLPSSAAAKSVWKNRYGW